MDISLEYRIFSAKRRAPIKRRLVLTPNQNR